MTTVQLQELARVGAAARLKAITEEREALLRVFPDLGNESVPPKRASSTSTPSARKRSGMSPAQRKAVGERMKAYWAKRRGEKTGTQTKSAPQTGSASEASPTPAERKGMSAEARKAQGERMRAYWAARRAQKQGGSAKRAGRKIGRKKEPGLTIFATCRTGRIFPSYRVSQKH